MARRNFAVETPALPSPKSRPPSRRFVGYGAPTLHWSLPLLPHNGPHSGPYPALQLPGMDHPFPELSHPLFGMTRSFLGVSLPVGPIGIERHRVGKQLEEHHLIGNTSASQRFRLEVVRAWQQWLSRRSNRARLPWERFALLHQRDPLPAATLNRRAAVT